MGFFTAFLNAIQWLWYTLLWKASFLPLYLPCNILIFYLNMCVRFFVSSMWDNIIDVIFCNFSKTQLLQNVTKCKKDEVWEQSLNIFILKKSCEHVLFNNFIIWHCAKNGKPKCINNQTYPLKQLVQGEIRHSLWSL